MGGTVAQALLDRAPALVDRLILASSGPLGGPGLTAMTGVMVRGILRGAATFTNPTTLLFFPHMVSVGNAEALHAPFPDAAVQLYRDTGHGVVFQNRDAITDVIRRFLHR